jgi:hypothetical protein
MNWMALILVEKRAEQKAFYQLFFFDGSTSRKKAGC